ncbi:hypothetical protein CJ030_MR3G009370 [Morella rubra]|uniref:Uncharacterized protein n=1 Tax=Morella rubra TaxID=262757 RepID=A0A6A1WCW5_9ROSI|nr:hypothetical protein CJ030_MR3G009370 [Morella rubra]
MFLQPLSSSSGGSLGHSLQHTFYGQRRSIARERSRAFKCPALTTYRIFKFQKYLSSQSLGQLTLPFVTLFLLFLMSNG